MNKQQLASKIWASANKMRSKIEANEYKDYILGFIFYKFLSDKVVELATKEDMTDELQPQYLTEENSEWAEHCRQTLGYFVAYNDLFSTWIKPDRNFSVGDVRDALTRFARLINPAHEKVYKGIFDTLQNGLSKLGESVGAQTKAVQNLLNLIKDIPTDDRQDYDVLGFIYEYLISNFAANAGKKAGEFYTPHEVALMMSEIVAHHLSDRSEIKIYDPTSGSGSLLLNIGRSVAKYLDKDKITYYAQELKEATYNLTRMNLVMRGIHPDNIVVRNGDTLEEDWPWFDDSDPTSTYDPLYCDAVVSNPPYSQEWYPKEETASDPRYKKYGVAPKGTADYAFLLHDLYHVKPGGIMTIVLPHGVLFRGGNEEEIRRNLIENNNIDAIIGLPANIFFGTGIPTIVMVLRQKRERDDVLFVDASKGFIKVGKNNQLRARDIRKIVDAVTERREMPKFSRRVDREEIRRNDYNLNIPRYVNSAEADEQWDIYATMFGGIPNNELDSFTNWWDIFPSLRNALFNPVNEAYSKLTPSPDQIFDTIRRTPEVSEYQLRYLEAVNPLRDALIDIVVNPLSSPERLRRLNPAIEFNSFSAHLFEVIKPFTLIDSYAAYQILEDNWRKITFDLETLQSEGIEAANAVDENIIIKKKDGKDVEVQDGWVGRILPFELVQRELLSAELGKLAKLQEERDATIGRIAEILESLPEAEGATPWIKDDGSAFVPKELKAKVKKIKQEFGLKLPEDSTEAMLVEADKLIDLEKKQKKAVSEATDILQEETIALIRKLPMKDILHLLVAKWIEPVRKGIANLFDKEVKDFAEKLDALDTKYCDTLVNIDERIAKSEKSLASLIDNLTGSDFDMAGLREFQNFCAMSKTLKPQIRFNGYEDEWQLKSLGDVCHSFKYGLNAAATTYDGKHKYLRITDIDDDNNTFNKEDLTSPNITCFTDEYKLSVKDIVFARTGASVGKTYLYNANDGNVYWAGFLIKASVNQNYDENFVFQNTLTNRYWRYIGIASQRSGQPGVNATEYGEFDFYIAQNINEQREIGEYFSNLDTQIKEAEREVDRLEKMKIASLQKMFPRPGATAPEIRFAGFYEPWKTMAFRGVYSSLKNNTLSRDCLNYNNGVAKNIHYGDVLIKFGAFVNPLSIEVPYVNSNVSLELSSSYKLADGDVIFADTAEDEVVGKCTEIRGVGDTNVVSGLHTIAVRPNFTFAPYYLGYYHNSNAYHSQLLPLMQGVKVLSINRTAISETMVAFPSSLDEQKAIGEYFRNLDELITAKRKSIVKLRNIKKACLSKMFVNDTEL